MEANRLPAQPHPPGINVLAIVKGCERVVFIFDDDHEAEVLDVMRRFAANPDLSFSDDDEEMLSQRVRKGIA